MSFYKFYQNNSGGRRTAGMPGFLFVEADSADEANERAESIGVYFNGTDEEDGRDCSCCGDRWGAASEYDKTEDLKSGYEWALPWGVLKKGSYNWEQIEVKP